MARMKSADTEFVVEAPVDTVWGILSDVNNWYQWNVFPFRARGAVAPGARIWFGMRERGLVPIPLARWEVVDAERELSWGGSAVGVRVQHGLWLEPLDGGAKTLVQHSERVEGWAARLIPGVAVPIWRRGLRNINRGLAAKAQQS